MMNKKNIDTIIDNHFVVLVDSREKRNEHIIKAFNKYNIKYKVQKLNYGDYGCIITPNDVIGNKDDLQMKVSVERKRSLEEIGSNLTNEKTRFAKEMLRCVEDDGTMIIMIEEGTYEDIAYKNYDNDILPKSFLGLLHSIYSTYNIPFIFIGKVESPLFIYNILKSFTKNYLKNI